MINYEPERIDEADYLRISATSEEKLEFIDSEIIAMAGGSPNHAFITGNIYFALKSELRTKGSNCRAVNSKLRIRINKNGDYYYSDASVFCEPPEYADDDQNAATNPILLVEVISPSSEARDRGTKFFNYRSLPSFREYVLISSDRPLVETYYRESATYIGMRTTIGLAKTVYLQSLDIHLPIQEIYADTVFPEEAA